MQTENVIWVNPGSQPSVGNKQRVRPIAAGWERAAKLLAEKNLPRPWAQGNILIA
jgi:hypothetical protein